VTSKQHLSVNFNPSALLSIGDLLAFGNAIAGPMPNYEAIGGGGMEGGGETVRISSEAAPNMADQAGRFFSSSVSHLCISVFICAVNDTSQPNKIFQTIRGKHGSLLCKLSRERRDGKYLATGGMSCNSGKYASSDPVLCLTDGSAGQHHLQGAPEVPHPKPVWPAGLLLG